MGPRCSSAETQVCHRSYIIAASINLKQDSQNRLRSNIPEEVNLYFNNYVLGNCKFQYLKQILNKNSKKFLVVGHD